MKYRYLERRDGDSTRLDSARLDAFSSFREKENRIARVGRVPTDTRELPVPASGAFSPGSRFEAYPTIITWKRELPLIMHGEARARG